MLPGQEWQSHCKAPGQPIWIVQNFQVILLLLSLIDLDSNSNTNTQLTFLNLSWKTKTMISICKVAVRIT